MRFFALFEKGLFSATQLTAFAAAGALFSLILAVALRKTTAFFSCGTAFFIFSAFCGEACIDFSAEDKKAFVVLLFCLYALLFAVYLIFAKTKSSHEEKKRRFDLQRRGDAFVLPEKRNGYVRDKLRAFNRLHENDEERANGEDGSFFSERNGERAEEIDVRTRHALSLLGRLKGKKLSVSDRIEIDDLEKKISSFSDRTAFTAEEIHSLSDSFSASLKMAAKYLT